MDGAAVSPGDRKLPAEERLLAHCVAIEGPDEGRRPPVYERLHELIGRDLDCRIVRSLTR